MSEYEFKTGTRVSEAAMAHHNERRPEGIVMTGTQLREIVGKQSNWCVKVSSAGVYEVTEAGYGDFTFSEDERITLDFKYPNYATLKEVDGEIYAHYSPNWSLNSGFWGLERIVESVGIKHQWVKLEQAVSLPIPKWMGKARNTLSHTYHSEGINLEFICLRTEATVYLAGYIEELLAKGVDLFDLIDLVTQEPDQAEDSAGKEIL